MQKNLVQGYWDGISECQGGHLQGCYLACDGYAEATAVGGAVSTAFSSVGASIISNLGLAEGAMGAFQATMAQMAIDLIANFKLSHGLQIPDAIIGATAIVYDIPLYTYNIKDFKFMPNINLYTV